MLNAQQIGVAELEKVGVALFGKQWQSDLARALGLSDSRRIRQWLSGDRPIPAGIWPDAVKLLKERKILLDDVLAEIEEKSGE